MNKKISTPIAIGIILILTIALIIFIIWQNTIITPPLIKINKSTCTQDAVLNNKGEDKNICNRSCKSDGDCKEECGCGCISKEEKCIYTGLECEAPNPDYGCKCIDNNCSSGYIGKDETADWEIYENPSMSFSIKYNPAEWVWKKYEFSEKESSANPVLASKSLGMQLDYKDSYQCFIQFIKSTPYNINTGEVPTFEDLVKSNKEGVERMIEKIIKENMNIAISKEVTEENIKVDGNSAVELSYIISTKVYRIFIPLSEEGETFQIGYYGYTTSNCEDMFYQMLSTFKFID